MPKITLADNREVEVSDEMYKSIEFYATLTKPVQKKGRVEEHKKYFYVDDQGYVLWSYERNDKIDDYHYLTGNYFHTKEEAEKHLEYVKALGRVTRRIEELNGGEEGKWVISYKNNKFGLAGLIEGKFAFKLPRCATEVIAQQIISECESDLKVIYKV